MSQPQEFKVGDFIFHNIHGVGKIVEFSETGKTATVDFQTTYFPDDGFSYEPDTIHQYKKVLTKRLASIDK